MTHHYLGRVHKFYICNMSWMLGSIAGMVKAVLTERQRQKLNFLSSAAELRKDFALHQLEEDVGGARPVFQETSRCLFNATPCALNQLHPMAHCPSS